MDCPSCGSTDIFDSDNRIELKELWAEVRLNCNECGARFKVDITLKIDNVEEIEDEGI